MAEEPKAHDETPPEVGDHPFEPRGEWWSLCMHCGLARAAHSSSTIDTRLAMFEDQMKRYGEIRHVNPERKAELNRIHQGGRVRIGYYSDDNLDTD